MEGDQEKFTMEMKSLCEIKPSQLVQVLRDKQETHKEAQQAERQVKGGHHANTMFSRIVHCLPLARFCIALTSLGSHFENTGIMRWRELEQEATTTFGVSIKLIHFDCG